MFILSQLVAGGNSGYCVTWVYTGPVLLLKVALH